MRAHGIGQDQDPYSISHLLAEIWADPYGLTSPSVYETARVVSLAPWLTGHAQRVRFLLRSQHLGGSWGAADGYGLVPTLSATEALLAGPHLDATAEKAAAQRGLRVLFSWLNGGS